MYSLPLLRLVKLLMRMKVWVWFLTLRPSGSFEATKFDREKLSASCYLAAEQLLFHHHCLRILFMRFNSISSEEICTSALCGWEYKANSRTRSTLIVQRLQEEESAPISWGAAPSLGCSMICSFGASNVAFVQNLYKKPLQGMEESATISWGGAHCFQRQAWFALLVHQMLHFVQKLHKKLQVVHGKAQPTARGRICTNQLRWRNQHKNKTLFALFCAEGACIKCCKSSLV